MQNQHFQKLFILKPLKVPLKSTLFKKQGGGSPLWLTKSCKKVYFCPWLSFQSLPGMHFTTGLLSDLCRNGVRGGITTVAFLKQNSNSNAHFYGNKQIAAAVSAQRYRTFGRTSGTRATEHAAFPLSASLSTVDCQPLHRSYDRCRSSGAAAMPMRRSSSW
jgi:hypothetical protein